MHLTPLPAPPATAGDLAARIERRRIELGIGQPPGLAEQREAAITKALKFLTPFATSTAAVEYMAEQIDAALTGEYLTGGAWRDGGQR